MTRERAVKEKRELKQEKKNEKKRLAAAAASGELVEGANAEDATPSELDGKTQTANV